MTRTLIEMSEDEFDDQYPPLTNHLNPHAGWVLGEAGCLFETYGQELEFVRQQDPSNVWTLVDGDHGDQYLLSGFHFVNRIGYLVSTVAVPEGVVIKVRISLQTDTTDEPGEYAAGLGHANRLLSDIAHEQLGIPTLDAQGSDSLDFHDVAVWQVKVALKAAFDAGAHAAGLLLDMVRYGAISLADGEAEFNGTIYAFDDDAPDWHALLDAIGWDAATAAIRESTAA